MIWKLASPKASNPRQNKEVRVYPESERAPKTEVTLSGQGISGKHLLCIITFLFSQLLYK